MLSDALLENVRECETSKDMWIPLVNVFESHTILRKLIARRIIYTATFQDDEKILLFSNIIRQYEVNGVEIVDK